MYCEGLYDQALKRDSNGIPGESHTAWEEGK